ncbi:MAG: GGDEF domain-containing protein, partial [Candidatus Zixiibacteriota bacterium]
LLRENGQCDLGQLAATDSAASEWARTLKENGLDYAALFPLNRHRSGVFVWSSPDGKDTVTRRLDEFRRDVFCLIDNAEAYEELEEMSYTDNLTGLANRRYFAKRLTEEINRARRYSRRLALIFFDLDELKTTNDRFGHLAGDSVLQQVGQILRSNVRSIDIVARYGGDEFCIIMPEADFTTCSRFMERLRSQVASWKFALEGASEPVSCTISQGGALFPDHAETPEKLIHAADMALLKAKESGRNGLVIFEPVTALS